MREILGQSGNLIFNCITKTQPTTDVLSVPFSVHFHFTNHANQKKGKKSIHFGFIELAVVVDLCPILCI